MVIKMIAGLIFTMVPVDKVKDFIDGIIISIDFILANPGFIFGIGEWNVFSFRLYFLELVMIVDDLFDFRDWVKDGGENSVDLVGNDDVVSDSYANNRSYVREFVVVEVFVQISGFHAVVYFQQVYWFGLELEAFVDWLQCEKRMGLSFIGQDVNIFVISDISIENNFFSLLSDAHHVNNLKYYLRNIEFENLFQVLEDFIDVCFEFEWWNFAIESWLARWQV
jgi:hypothetical protein